MSFLKAEWRKLILASYKIDPNILQPYVPFGTKLDSWNGNTYVSLVGFMFVNTRVLGMKIPFHINFEEVNLRFYVKRKGENGDWKRGVVFIKEIVPKSAITFIANTLYKEHYQTLPMKHSWFEDEKSLNVIYEWHLNDKWNKIAVNTHIKPISIVEGSKEEFITEHYWGYAKHGDDQSNEYEVTHPQWETYQIKHFAIDVDYQAVYGDDFGFLSDSDPDSVMLAEGSEISVENKRIISS
ncbi:MAG: DUF2071 domain-containing protein [Flavobacteriales bacterium]|nr:DUF2071 domain-containing protein [Flavobacteriales bacterium]